MTDYTELIHRLRSTKSRSKRKLIDEAAEAIEQLANENEEVRDAANDMLEEMGELYEDIRKRDDAAATIEMMLSDIQVYGGCDACKWDCFGCTHPMGEFKDMSFLDSVPGHNCPNWKWKGGDADAVHTEAASAESC